MSRRDAGTIRRRRETDAAARCTRHGGSRRPCGAAPPPASVAPVPARPAAPVTSPLSAERYKVQFTVGRETHDKLRRAQDLLRHSIPDGDPAEILDRALTLLLEHLERTKLAQTKAPRQTSRPLAAEVVTSPHPCAAPSGHVMAVGVRSQAARVAAPRQHSSSFTTSSHSHAAERRRQARSSFAAVPPPSPA